MGHGDCVGAARAFCYDLDRHSRCHRGRIHLHGARSRADEGCCRAPRLGGADRRAASRGLRAARWLQLRCLCDRLDHDLAMPGGLNQRSSLMSSEVQANKKRSYLLYEEIFGKGNYEMADELMAADIINHGPGVPAGSGPEGIKHQAALLRTAP